MRSSILTCSATRQAAAVGSTNTAVRSSSESGTRVQVDGRQREVLGERAVAAEDAEDAPHVAVSPTRDTASVAAATTDGDLAGNATADSMGVIRRRVFDDADELVAGHARECRIAAQKLEIGAADAGRLDPDQAFIDWGGLVALLEGQPAASFEDERAHRSA